MRDVQNIVEILVDPQGEGRRQDFWDRSAKSILVGVVLHVLYAEPLERKTLAVVRERLRDLDKTAHLMKTTLYCLSTVTNLPETHPETLLAAERYLAEEKRLQSGVKATAESYFGLFADALAEGGSASVAFVALRAARHQQQYTARQGDDTLCVLEVRNCERRGTSADFEQTSLTASLTARKQSALAEPFMAKEETGGSIIEWV